MSGSFVEEMTAVWLWYPMSGKFVAWLFYR